MNQPEIRIYIGKISEWTKDIPNIGPKAESICVRRLLAYGLLDIGQEEILSGICQVDEVHESLEKKMERAVHGKPYFKDFSKIQFNFSHSGEYAACALSSVPCGLDIQEIRSVKSRSLLKRTMSLEEQKSINESENPEREFCRLWAMKESFLKLTGEGITGDMREIPKPIWYEVHDINSNMFACISAQITCNAVYMEVPAAYFFELFEG